jgi:hypothetical protein
VIGCLQVVNKHHNQVFTEDDINTLTTLASQAATAIENARLFLQSDFIAEMVHELRTPLAALKASTALILRPDLPPERRDEIITTMQGETQRLIRPPIFLIGAPERDRLKLLLPALSPWKRRVATAHRKASRFRLPTARSLPTIGKDQTSRA